MTQIKAKVATILTDHRLALNAGRSKGVRRGALVTIYQTVEVADPETHEPLGTVVVPKLTLKVIDVQESLSVAEVVERIGGDDGTLSSAIFSAQWKPLKRIARTKGFDDSGNIYIAVGDEAVFQTGNDPNVGDHVIPQGF